MLWGTYTDARGNDWIYGVTGSLLTSVTDPLGATTTYARDGNLDLVKVVDPRGGTWNMTWANHRLTDLSGPAGLHQTYTYNGAGDPITATDALGHSTGYAYDGPGSLTSIDPPGAGSISMTRQAGTGLVTSITDQRGNVTTAARRRAARNLPAMRRGARWGCSSTPSDSAPVARDCRVCRGPCSGDLPLAGAGSPPDSHEDPCLCRSAGDGEPAHHMGCGAEPSRLVAEKAF